MSQPKFLSRTKPVLSWARPCSLQVSGGRANIVLSGALLEPYSEGPFSEAIMQRARRQARDETGPVLAGMLLRIDQRRGTSGCVGSWIGMPAQPRKTPDSSSETDDLCPELCVSVRTKWNNSARRASTSGF